MMQNAKTIIPIILILVGLGVGFFGGYQYRNFRLRQTVGNFAGPNGTFQRFTGRNGGNGMGMMRNGVFGSILSIDNNSITVKLADGSSKIVLFSTSTTYANTASATQSDLKVGDNVAVVGAVNSDGSVTATNIQINPEFGRPQASPSPTPSTQ